MNLLLIHGVLGTMLSLASKSDLYAAAIVAAGNDYVLPIATPVGVIASAYVGWLIAKRKSSGTIQNSESQELWAGYGKLVAAGDKLREDLSKEVQSLREENRLLREQLATKTEQDAERDRQLAIALKRIEELEAHVKILRGGLND